MVSKLLSIENKLKAATRDGFIRNNLIFFCSSLIVAVFNYLYHPILGRIMKVADFGEVQTLISLFTEVTIITGVSRIIIVNVISNGTSEAHAKEIIGMLYKAVLCFAFIIGIAMIILSPYLKTFFHFSSFYPFVSLAIILISGLMLGFREAIPQGLSDFKTISISQIINSSGRLIFAVFLVFVGWSTLGAISAIIIAQLLAFSYVAPKTRNFFNHPWVKLKIDGRIKKELKYGALVLLVTLCVTFLYTADIIIVKHYFPSESAGLYSGISIIARIIFFVTSSIAAVMLPSIKINDINGQNGKILSKSLYLTFALGGVTLVIFSLFPEFIISIFIGKRYLAYADLLPRLGLVLFLTSIINILSYYMLALRNYGIAAVSAAGILAIFVASIFRHDTLIHVVDNFLFGAVIIVCLLFVLYFKNKFINFRVSRRFDWRR